jgi:hypothetical protein
LINTEAIPIHDKKRPREVPGDQEDPPKNSKKLQRLPTSQINMSLQIDPCIKDFLKDKLGHVVYTCLLSKPKHGDLVAALLKTEVIKEVIRRFAPCMMNINMLNHTLMTNN